MISKSKASIQLGHEVLGVSGAMRWPAGPLQESP